jgi:hypothetical protein
MCGAYFFNYYEFNNVYLCSIMNKIKSQTV